MMIELPFLNLNSKCRAENKMKHNSGMVTGCKRMLSNRLPFNNAMKLLCNPQPGQSICRKIRHGQGNWCFSSQLNINMNLDNNK